MMPLGSLIEKSERTPEEEDEMVHAAHASRYHWGRIGRPVHRARGEWQIARVYTVLNRPSSARFHAQRCLELCQAHGIGDFDVAFAHEGVARAAAAEGDRPAFEAHFRQARACGEQVGEPEDREQFFKDLESGPWFGAR